VYKDIEILDKRIDEVEHKIKRFNEKEALEEKETLLKVKALLDNKRWVRTGDWSNRDVEYINKHTFLTAK